MVGDAGCEGRARARRVRVFIAREASLVAILVTGGAGFIGSHLLESLLARNDQPVVALDDLNDYYDPRRKEANLLAVGRHPLLTFVRGDFCDEALVESLFRQHRFSAVFHLGAYAGVRVSVDRPLINQRVNVGGTLVLLEAVRRHPVRRFLLVSSSTVYGRGAAVPFSEAASPGVPQCPYGATKRAAELLALTYWDLHRVPVVCLRPFSVYGPRIRPDLAMNVFATAIHAGRSLPVNGDGTIRRDFTHVSDICRGLLAAHDADGAAINGQVINLGHNEPVAMLRLIDLLATALGRPARIDFLPARPEDLPVTCADLSRAARLLHYNPQMPLEQGVKDYVAWFLAQADNR